MIDASGAREFQVAALLLAAFAGVRAWRRFARAESRSLRWDGQAWHEIDVAGRALALGPPSVCLDLDAAVLLRARLQGSRSVRWLALERRGAPQRWHALRVAMRRTSAVAEIPLSADVADGRLS
jgi:hypothetical protein